MSRTRQVLFPIAVDPDALRDHPTDRDQLVHREVVTTLGDRGILSLPEVDREALYRAIEGLGDLSRTLWVKQLHGLYDLNRLDQIPHARGVGDRLRQPGHVNDEVAAVRLIVAAREAAEAHGVDDRSGYKTIDETDIVMAGTIHRSPALADRDTLGVFPLGTTRRAIIASGFLKPLAERSTAVKILDPHLLEDLISGYASPAHAEWLLRTLAGTMPPHSTLSILGRLQRQWQEADRAVQEARIEEFLNHVLSERVEPMTVRVRLLKATTLKNRFMWFSCGHSYDVLHNFAALSSDPLNEELRFTRQNDEIAQQTLQTAERIEDNTQQTMVSVTKTFP
ncbi:MAG: hypothetical protein LH624_05675 [Cryobacterium sp.]|nr:hypothetical protein [Cryobacterium sp.]